MGCQAVNGFVPSVDAEAFVAPGAQLVGDVRLERGASVWHNAVLRAEAAPIRIDAEANIQDGCLLHSEPERPCLVGQRVTVGHGAILHGCSVGANAVIGMGAVVLNSARIGTGAVVAAGAVVLENQVIPPSVLVAGVPARVVRPVRPDEVKRFDEGVNYYLLQATACKQEMATAKAAGTAET